MIKLQASSIYRNMNCPGSAAVEADTPENLKFKPFKNAADFGTRCHEVAENMLSIEFYHKKKASLPVELKIKGFKKGTEEYDRAHNAVNHYVKHFRKVARSSRHKNGNTVFLIEKKFRFIENDLDFEAVAKADGAILTYKQGTLYADFFDLKTGNFDYSESAREQIFFGALVMLVGAPPADAGGSHFPLSTRVSIGTHTVQPNYYNTPEKVVTEIHHIFELSDIVPKLLSYFHKANQQEYIPGDHCKFCSGILNCPAIQGRVNLMTTIMDCYSPAEVLPTEALENLYLLKPAVETYFKAVESVLYDRLETGETFETLQVSFTSGWRRWQDEKEVEKRLSFLGEDLYEKKIKSPAQVEKLAGKENISDLYYTPQNKKLVKRENPFQEVTK